MRSTRCSHGSWLLGPTTIQELSVGALFCAGSCIRVSEKTSSRHSGITVGPTLLSFLCSLFCLLCSLFRCPCALLGSIYPFPGLLHAFPGTLYAFLGPSSSAPSRWPARSTGRTRRTTRRSANVPGWTAWPAGGTFDITRRTFGSTTATRGRSFFIGRLCRFLVCRRLLLDVLLRSALGAEVGSFIGKLLAAVRTELGGLLGELRAALRAEVGSFIGELGATVRAS
jgi:hypothetical protein